MERQPDSGVQEGSPKMNGLLIVPLRISDIAILTGTDPLFTVRLLLQVQIPDSRLFQPFCVKFEQHQGVISVD
jgi:hypothetical protein